MVSDSLGVMRHTMDLNEHCTVPLGLERLGATTGSSMCHVLVDVMVTYSGPFFQCLNYPNLQVDVAPQPAGIRGRSSSHLKAGFKLRRQGLVSTSCGHWKVVQFPPMETESGKGENGVYTHSSSWDNLATSCDTDVIRCSTERSVCAPELGWAARGSFSQLGALSLPSSNWG